MKRTLQFLALVAAISVAPLRCVYTFAAVSDADIWLHMRVGEWIAEHMAFPHSGIFTQHMERPWVAYSWGFELLTAAAFRLGLVFHSNGLAGLTLFLVLMQALLALVIFIALERTSRRFFFSAAMTALVMYAYSAYAIRPMMFTILFYVTELYLLFAVSRDGLVRRLYWLPPIFIVWANLHIQFIYGLFALGVFAVASSVSEYYSRTGRLTAPTVSPRTAWLAFAASAVATCIGPYGWDVYGTIFNYASNTSQYQQVEEFAAMNFRQAPHYLALALILFAFFSLGWKRASEPFRVMLLVSTTIVAFRSQRDAWFVCIPAALLLAEALRREEASEAPVLRVAPAIAALFVAVLIGYAGAAQRGLSMQTLVAQVDRLYPVRAATWIADNHPPGPLYNTYNWGDYLIFNLRDYPVSIDGRTDLFGPDLDTRSMATVNAYDLAADPDFQRANVILVERFLPLAAYLRNDSRYKLVYGDEMANVFIKK